ncbi:MAG: hypothetical protein HKO66_07540 [Saprospiraceae bacterium]|nr:hypothetical protein [Bacteroidia bacterium]NNE14350.1 hypothetical protein [Saprospiraceae bacterium]NNL92067.1 hypothetical protein [Saprospiraceae bacterium]
MFKKLKSLFVIDEGDDNASSSQKAPDPSKSKQLESKEEPTIKIEKPQYSKANPPKGKVSEKFVNILLGAIEKNNVEGFDYLEFKQALQNLGSVEMDEATKFKSALAMAKTMGANKDKLFSSADLYLNVLSKEEKKFMESFSKQLNMQVNSRNDEIKNLENGISLKKKQIEELQQEIAKQEKTLQERKTNADKANAKVEATKDNFYHAYHIVAEQIKDDISKMKKYLG